jgi:fucose 4-O-acetylase-like acetyltransferase
MAILAGCILIPGILLWISSPGPLLTRSGYAELFYPPTLGFMIFITGLILCLFIIADRVPVSRGLFDPIRALGECSLGIYLMHIIIIDVIIDPLDLQVPLISFLGGYLLFITGMIVAAYLLRYTRQKVTTGSFMVRALIGG